MILVLPPHIEAQCKRLAGGCMVWCGKNNGRGLPRIGDRSARRAVWEYNTGEKLPRTLMVTCRCSNSLCLLHLGIITKAGAAAKGHAKPETKLRVCVANARSARSRGFVKMTMEKANLIRSMTGTCKELGRQFSVSPSLISLIRKNKAWVDYSHITMEGAGHDARK